MIAQLVIPPVEPGALPLPQRCAYPECDGRLFQFHQGDCPKSVVDTTQSQVKAARFRCLTCGRSFRVYPRGVSRDQQSEAVKELTVLLYGLGLSCRMISRLLERLGCFVGKSTIFRNIQAAGPEIQQVRSIGLGARCRWPQLRPDGSEEATHSDTPLTVTVSLDDAQRTVVSIEIPKEEEASSILGWTLDLARAAGVEVALCDAEGRPVQDNLHLHTANFLGDQASHL